MTQATITNSTKQQFLNSLRRAGIKKNSGSWNDYEVGKKLIPAGLIAGAEYTKYVRWVVEYVGV